MLRRSRRSIGSLSVPIVLASVAVPLSIALLVAWTVVLARGFTADREMGSLDVGLMVAGVISFLVIMGVLVTFAVFLGREILEVRRQDGFIDSVTHELKSPLASLKLGLQTLGRRGLGDEKQRELRSMMLEDVERLSTFIDDVVEAGRLADAPGGLHLEAVDAADVVRRVVRSVVARHHAPEGCVTLDLDAGGVRPPERPGGWTDGTVGTDAEDPDAGGDADDDGRAAVASPWRVRTDREALETVVRNLVDNALKYSGSPPEVAVRLRLDPAADRLVLEVVDRGIGLPPRQSRRIFQRFYRAPGEAVRERKGTGLGLFIVHALVRNLGGRIDAESPGEGMGTTFRVVLPRGKPA